MTSPLIVINEYQLIAPPHRFAAAISALAARVEAEGEPGVRSYRFFVSGDGETARAVIRYDGPGAWIGHHEISFPWPEMKAMHATARLARVTFLGPVSPEMRDWIASSPLTAELVHYDSEAAGFDR